MHPTSPQAKRRLHVREEMRHVQGSLAPATTLSRAHRVWDNAPPVHRVQVTTRSRVRREWVSARILGTSLAPRCRAPVLRVLALLARVKVHVQVVQHVQVAVVVQVAASHAPAAHLRVAVSSAPAVRDQAVAVVAVGQVAALRVRSAAEAARVAHASRSVRRGKSLSCARPRRLVA